MQGMKAPATSAQSVATPKIPPARTRLAQLAVRIAALWLLSVSLIKLFKGSPSDLPLMVQNFWGAMDLGLKFQLVVGIELSVGFLALLRPRWAWPLLVGMFSLFVAMLASMIAAGDSSCGCFGGAISMQPATMLMIDAACLLAILFTRPWSSLPATKVPWPLLLVAMATAWAAPFLAFKNIQLPTQPPTVAPTAQGWQLPAELPQFHILNPNGNKSRNEPSWAGRALKDTALGKLLDVELSPQDATWILYRITCEHCAKELIKIANDPELAAKLYVLVRIPEDGEESAVQVHQFPPMFEEVILPRLARGYVGQTPWMLDVAGGVVLKVTPGDGVDGETQVAPGQ
jgi:hypothetical protein